MGVGGSAAYLCMGDIYQRGQLQRKVRHAGVSKKQISSEGGAAGPRHEKYMRR